ncbi:hypothetical protein INR49_019535 [Caranx melampygus]|nr:hypothetical protein INR49_019535 [Caranx melampygus]
MCPVCQAILRPGELQEHMEQELAKLAQLQISATPVQHEHLIRTPKSLSLSLHIKREGGSPTSPLDQLRTPTLTDTRCYVKSAPLRPHSAGAHLDCTQAVRIGKLKRRKPEDGQEGSADLVPLEDEWNERRRIQMTSIVGGFKGAMLVSTTSKDCRDSDADLDVDGDDTLEYGRAQYTETDVIPCSGESSKETTANPSTSSREKVDGSVTALPKTCKNTEIEMEQRSCVLNATPSPHLET